MNKTKLLDELLRLRCDTISRITPEDAEFLKAIKLSESYNNILIFLNDNNIPQKDEIRHLLNTLDDTYGLQMAYFCDKYYRNGFYYAIHLIIECIENYEKN